MVNEKGHAIEASVPFKEPLTRGEGDVYFLIFIGGEGLKHAHHGKGDPIDENRFSQGGVRTKKGGAALLINQGSFASLL